MLFERAPIYAVTHILAGFLGAWYTVILVLAVVYQLSQYFFHVRFFLFELSIKSGNSIQHTSLKLLEILLGYLIGLFVRFAILV